MEINSSIPTTKPAEPESGKALETDKLKKTNPNAEFMSYILGLPNANSEIKTPEIDMEAVDTVEVEIPTEELSSGDLSGKLMLKAAAEGTGDIAQPESDADQKLFQTDTQTFAELMENSEKEMLDVEVEQSIQRYMETAAQQAEESPESVSNAPDAKASFLVSVPSGSPTSAEYVETAKVAEKPAVSESSLQQMFEGVQSLAHRGGGKMTLSLNPAHLGQMEIEVHAKGNRVSVEMVSESHAAKAMIESQLADLRTAMQSQDLILSNVQVQVGQEGRWASGRGAGEFSQGRRESSSPALSRRMEAVAPVKTGFTANRLSTGRLDMRI